MMPNHNPDHVNRRDDAEAPTIPHAEPINGTQLK
jgi:hypothetical protein